MVTYRYTDGTAPTATLQFHVSNAWLEPLPWRTEPTEPHHDPHAMHSTGSRSTNTAPPPTEHSPPGFLETRALDVRASVAPSPEHAGLTAVTEFHILKARLSTPFPQT